MNLSVPTRNVVLEVVYELIWITIIVMALICGLFFGVPRDAIAQNLIESPPYDLQANPETKEQYEAPNSRVPLTNRISHEKFEGGALHEEGVEQNVGEMSDYTLSNGAISEQPEIY